MITKKQRTAYKKSIGKRYTKTVRAYLTEQNVLSKEGKPYADSTIWRVFNGGFENPAIENAFYELSRPKEK